MKSIKLLGVIALAALSLAAFSSVASAAGPGFFVADSYPTTVKGTYTGEIGKITTEVGTSNCASPDLEASLAKHSETLTTSVKYYGGSCANMNANGCEFTFHPPSEGVNGSFDIAGSKCKAMTLQQAGTPISIPAQNGLAATFENEGSGTGAKIKVKAAAAIKYEVVGDGKGIRTGSYQTTWNVVGSQGASPAGIRVQLFPGLSVINSAEGPVFHSELYPVTIGGEQTTALKWTTKAGVLKCSTATFGTPTWATGGVTVDSSEMLLSASIGGGCTLAGLAATVTPAECNYTLSLTGAAPFVGSMSMCNTQIAVSGSKCVVTVSNQTRSGMEYTNAGSGPNATVQAKANITGIEYQVASNQCPNEPAPGSYSDGKETGVITLKIAKVLN